jgi:adenylate cyclase, class 2
MSHANEVERELKFGGVDHNKLRERLEALEAESQGSPALEDNWIYDRDDHLLDAGKVLRLRVDRRGVQLTFKGPAKYDGKVKIRAEHQTTVGDEKQIRQILEALGYSVVRRYQKYREEWRLGSIVIALDHTPIGDFAELEGEGCERVAKRCGLDPETADRRSYLRLYEDHRKSHPEAPPFMVFP